MLNKSLLFLFSFLLIFQISKAQKEANIWYFGANAGINFNTSQPTAITNSKMFASEGCASISNAAGRLLFYTDGVSVWDSTHQVMPNGSDLKGNASSTQSVVIVPKPFTFNSYFIFTSDKVAGSEGITYSEVNMGLNGGKGDVLNWNKNKKLVSPACEKLSAVKHGNGFDYWIMAHKFNSDTLYAYRVTMYGIIPRAVKSKTGFKISNGYSNSLGSMKFSPDGRKLAYVNYTKDTSVIADFNNQTGIISNPYFFNNSSAYGLEFSSKSRYIYISEFKSKKIYQYDAKAISSDAFISSKKTIDSNYANELGALQLAPNGKIYIAVTGSNYLHSIEAPDSFGSLSRPVKNSIFLGGKTCLLGLPNFNTSLFNLKTILAKSYCLNDTAEFSISNTEDIDSVKWFFGEPIFNADNYSTKAIGARHIYKKTGKYFVWLYYYSKKSVQFAFAQINVKDIKPNIGRDTSFCNAFSLKLSTAKSYQKYLWNTSEITPSLSISKKGTYILRVNDSIGCSSADTIVVHNPFVVAKITTSDTIQCSKNNLFKIINGSFIDDDQIKYSHWTFGDGTSIDDTVVLKEYKAVGQYKIKLNVVTKTDCKDSATKNLHVKLSPMAAFQATSPCFPDSVVFTNQSTFGAGKLINFWWEFGDNTFSTQKSPYKFYKEPSKYNVKLVIRAENGCIDSLVKHRGILVKESPHASFTFNEISSLNGGQKQVQFNNFSTDNAVLFSWNFGNGKTSSDKNPILNYLDSGKNTFTLIASTADGCSDSYSLNTYHKFFFFLPNVFSPDGNNINDSYVPFSSLFISYYKMEIFNKWGEKLFESNDILNGWDGKYHGEYCTNDLYICKIALTPYGAGLQKHETSFLLMH